MPVVDVVGVVYVVDVFDAFDTQPGVTCAIDQLNTRLDNQPDRFFNFPIFAYFRLGSSRPPNNAIKKII
jgi:hypothetical protein